MPAITSPVTDAMAGHKLNADQEDYFDLLGRLIEDFEAERVPPPKVTGLEALQHLLEAPAMNAADLARVLHVHRTLGGMILRCQHCFIDGGRQCLTQTFMPKHAKPVPFAAIESRIHLIRGSKVMLDADLAELYGVATKNLNRAFQRNRDRFPEDFMYQLTRQEVANLRFQIGTQGSHGGRRHMPYCLHPGRHRHAVQRSAQSARRRRQH